MQPTAMVFFVPCTFLMIQAFFLKINLFKLDLLNLFNHFKFELALITFSVTGTCLFKVSKAGLTLNDLYDTTCMTHNRFSNFHCVYTNIQVVHTEFIKVVRTDYSTFKISRKMIQEQAAAAVIIALISKSV